MWKRNVWQCTICTFIINENKEPRGTRSSSGLKNNDSSRPFWENSTWSVHVLSQSTLKKRELSDPFGNIRDEVVNYKRNASSETEANLMSIEERVNSA